MKTRLKPGCSLFMCPCIIPFCPHLICVGTSQKPASKFDIWSHHLPLLVNQGGVLCEVSHFVLLYGTIFYTISRLERRRCRDSFSRARRLCPSCTKKFASTSGGGGGFGGISSRTTLGLARRTLGARTGASSRFFLFFFSGSGSGSAVGSGSGSTTSVFSTSISFYLPKTKVADQCEPRKSIMFPATSRNSILRIFRECAPTSTES